MVRGRRCGDRDGSVVGGRRKRDARRAKIGPIKILPQRC